MAVFKEEPALCIDTSATLSDPSDGIDLQEENPSEVSFKQEIYIFHVQVNFWEDDVTAAALSAVLAGDPALLRRVLESKERLSNNYNYVEFGGKTLLHLAIQQKEAQLVKILLEAKVCSPSYYNTVLQVCPLHVAVQQGCGEALSVLLSHLGLSPGQLLETRDRWGRTPLLLAAQGGEPMLPCLRLLLEAGADINATDDTSGDCVISMAGLGSFPGCWDRFRKSIISRLIQL